MATLLQSKTFASALAAEMQGRTAPDGLRSSVGAGSFDAVLEHHRAVIFLVETRHFGSAFALLRLMYDGCIIGLWATYVATPDLLELFESGRFTPEPPRVLKQLKRHDDGEYAATLQRIHDQSWKILSTYVHGGHLQVSRRNAAEYVGPNYTDDEILDLLTFANAMATIAAMEIPGLTQDEPFSKAINAIVSEYVKTQA